MVGFFCESTKEGADGVVNNIKTKTLNESERDILGCEDHSTELDGLSLASLEPFVDFDFIKDWIEEMQVPDSEECNNADIGSGIGEYSCLDNPTGDVFARGMDGKETCGTVKAECWDTDELVVENRGGMVGNMKSDDFEESSLTDFVKADLGSADISYNDHQGDIMSSVKLEDETGVSMLNVRSCSIEEGLEKVSLGGTTHGLVIDVNDKIEMDSKVVSKDAGTNMNSDSDSESESETSSSSSSSSGSADEAKEMVKVEVLSKTKTVNNEQKVEVEEGEIMDSDEEKMVSWTDNDNDDENDEDQDDNASESSHDLELGDILDDDDGDAELPKGPIRSKNELQDLPLVPPVTVSLQPSHQISPVGVVLSVVGTQVIVEGSEKHNPISEGSILWITERRLPLGIIDEIFGPVKTPYYIVRYNLETEVPSDIQTGTRIGFVSEFVGHVLNDKKLYQKGYDASGENDEEIDETEFSDDEKEAEYKRMLKMSKRGNNNEIQVPGTKKKNTRNVKGRENTWTKNQPSASQSPALEIPPSQPSKIQQHLRPPSPFFTQGNHSGRPSAQSFGQSNQSSSSPLGPTFSGGPNTFNQMPQQGPVTLKGNWTNGMPSQPQNMAISNGFQLNGNWANNGMPSQPQNMGMSSGFQLNGNWPNNGMPSQPQSMATASGFPPNGMPWLQQNYPQPSNGPISWQQQQLVSQFPLGTLGPSQPQFDLSQLLTGSLLGQMNFNMGTPNSPWSGMLGPNLSGQAPFMNPDAQLHMFSGLMSNGPEPTGLNSNHPNEEVSAQTHQGVSSGRGRGRGRGRKSFQQRGGRFGGRRGR
ncbi:hypothetical protein KSS87_002263 [Heliosperma pusillum]|nr:hypothetical protein KSS87_002263 [Heliosperma pusillum]